MQKPIAIISTGNTFSSIQAEFGDFHQWIASGMGRGELTVHIHAHTLEALPAFNDIAGVVITGSHAMVTEAHPWSEDLARWLHRAVSLGLPVLGICYGHQLLAHAFGGEVGYNPRGIEIGTHRVALTTLAENDPLLAVLPQQFNAHLVHSQSVLNLPPEAQALARNSHDPHQIFRIGHCAWGVQFHPEFNELTMRAYIKMMQESLAKNGLSYTDTYNAVKETHYASLLLSQFTELVRQNEIAQLNA